MASFPELGFAHGCWKTLLQREQQGGSPGQRAELKGAEGQGFIHCFSCWEAAGWEVEAKVFELRLSGVGLCLMIRRQSEVELCSSEQGVELLWSGETH